MPLAASTITSLDILAVGGKVGRREWQKKQASEMATVQRAHDANTKKLMLELRSGLERIKMLSLNKNMNKYMNAVNC